jgi:hypothetical protein
MRNFLLALVIVAVVMAAAFVPAPAANKLFDCFLAVCVVGGGSAFVIGQCAEGLLALRARRKG